MKEFSMPDFPFDKSYIDYIVDRINCALANGDEKLAARFESYLYSDFIYYISVNAPEEFAVLAREVLQVERIAFRRPSAREPDKIDQIIETSVQYYQKIAAKMNKPETNTM